MPGIPSQTATKESTSSSWRKLLRKKKSKGNLAQSYEETAPSLPRPSLTSLRSFGSSKSSNSSHSHGLPTLASTLPSRPTFGRAANSVDSWGRRQGRHIPKYHTMDDSEFCMPAPPFARDVDFPQSAPPDQPAFVKFFPPPNSLDDMVSRGSLDERRQPKSAPPVVSTFTREHVPVRTTNLSRRSSTTSKVPPVVTWLDKENAPPIHKFTRPRRGTLTDADAPLSAPASINTFPDLPPLRKRANSVTGTRPLIDSTLQVRMCKRNSVLARSRMSTTSENKARSANCKTRHGKEDIPPVPPVPPLPSVPSVQAKPYLANFPASQSVVDLLAQLSSSLDGDEPPKFMAIDWTPPYSTTIITPNGSSNQLPSPSWLSEDPFASAFKSFTTAREADAIAGMNSWDTLDLSTVMSYKPTMSPSPPQTDEITDVSALLDAYHVSGLDSPSFYSHESSFDSACSGVPSIRLTEYHNPSFEEEKSVQFAEVDGLDTSGKSSVEDEDGEMDWLELQILLSMFPRPPPLLRTYTSELDESNDVWTRLYLDPSFESTSTPPLVAELRSHNIDDIVMQSKSTQTIRKKRQGIMFF